MEAERTPTAKGPLAGDSAPSAPSQPALLTVRFVLMCAFTFTAFISLFQLIPVAPYRIEALGGSTAVAGLFLGLLTYSSAIAAPFAGQVVDRIGSRRALIVVALLLALISLGYAFIADLRTMYVVAVVHGVIWSALLSASPAYVIAAIPANRRAEGLGYWGASSVLGIAVAPVVGFAVYASGWKVLCVEMSVLNLLMAFVASRLESDRPVRTASEATMGSLGAGGAPGASRGGVDGRSLYLAVTVGLAAFSYGGIQSFSAPFADAIHLQPRSLFMSVMAGSIVVSRLTGGRYLDRIDPRVALLSALGALSAGMLCLAFSGGRAAFVLAAAIYGIALGVLLPSFQLLLMHYATPARRAAAFGAMYGAFDAGIGAGSSLTGWLVAREGFRFAWAVGMVFVLLAVPYFLVVDRRLRRAVTAMDAGGGARGRRSP